jgi:large subunit ribosomal protein L4
MAVPTFTATGTKATTAAKLDATVFTIIPENHELLRSAYVTYLANGRLNLATTKNRGDVSGGGKKPWKQKGTGKARFGSSRNPIWRGGGVAFGPTGLENYSVSLNAKAKRQAVRQALSLAAQENKLIVIAELKLKEAKTALLADLLIKIGAHRRIVLCVDKKDDFITRAMRNLPQVMLVAADHLNVVDLLNADSVVVTTSALDVISTWLGGAK